MTFGHSHKKFRSAYERGVDIRIQIMKLNDDQLFFFFKKPNTCFIRSFVALLSVLHFHRLSCFHGPGTTGLGCYIPPCFLVMLASSLECTLICRQR